jgi:hypothetical protein
MPTHGLAELVHLALSLTLPAWRGLWRGFANAVKLRQRRSFTARELGI